MKRKKKQNKTAPLTMKLAACVACGLYFYMIGCVFMSEPEKPRVKQVRIAKVIEETKPVILVKPAKELKAPKKPVDKQEEHYSAMLLYGTDAEYEQAKAWFAGKKPGYVEANKLMARR